MKFFKKVCVFLLAWFLVSAFSFSDARSPFVQEDWNTHKKMNVDPAKLDDDEMTDIEHWIKYENEKQNWVLKFPKKEDYSSTLWYALSLIQISINWILWILATVALVYMLYCGFLVFTSWSDDKNAQKWRKWISTAAIALAWIGLSWMIVSAMIRFITIMTGE